MNINSIKAFTYQCFSSVRNQMSEFSLSAGSKLWVIANKIKKLVFFWQTSPLVRTFEEQQTFNSIKNRYQNLSRERDFIVPNAKAKILSLNLITPLSKNDSKPIQELRMLAREFAAASIECAQEESENSDLKSVLKLLTPVIPVITDILSQIIGNIIQNLSFDKIIDQAVGIIDAEVECHILAQKAFDEEKKRLDYAKSICYPQDGVVPNISLDDYDRANQFLEETTTTGAEALLKETYATTYDQSIAAGDNEEKAKQKALKAREMIQQDSSFETFCQNAYLRDYYLTKFAESNGMTETVKNIALAKGVDKNGHQYLDVHNYLNEIAKTISEEVISLFKTHLNNALFPLEYWNNLEILDAPEINAEKQKIIEQIVQIFVTKAIANLLEMLVIPQKINNFMADDVLPQVEYQMTFQIVQTIIQDNWKELAPNLYAYEIANEFDKSSILNTISSKLWDKVDKDLTKDISRHRFDKALQEILNHDSKKHKLISKALMEMENTVQFPDFIRHCYELVVSCRENTLKKEEMVKKRESTLAGLKAEALYICAETLNDKNPEAFYPLITPLIEKLEKKLIYSCENTDQMVDEAFIKKHVIEFLKRQKTYSVNPSGTFGKLVFNVGNWGGIAPNTHYFSSWIPGAHGYVKKQISDLINTSIAPYRKSHHLLIKTLVHSLISQFSNVDKTGIDKEKLKKKLFKDKIEKIDEESKVRYYDCESRVESSVKDELKNVAALTFGLTQQVVSPTLYKGLQYTLIGENPDAIADALAKIKPGLLDQRLINLSRVAKLSNILVTNVHEAQTKIDNQKKIAKK